MSDVVMFDAVQAVRDNLKQFLREQMKAKPDDYGPSFEHACDAEARLALYFDEIPVLELFEPGGYLDFAHMLLQARELELVSPEQDDAVCAALGEIWNSLTRGEQVELETKVAKL